MFVINLFAENPPTSQTPLFVNGFTSGNIKDGVFCFAWNGVRVDFGCKGRDENYDYLHHFDKMDLRRIGRQFPGTIPERDARTRLEPWGEKVREGLSRLVIEGHLYADGYDESGSILRKRLEWDREPYERNLDKM